MEMDALQQSIQGAVTECGKHLAQPGQHILILGKREYPRLWEGWVDGVE